MSKRDIGVARSCLGHGCGFTAYTSPPSKYEKHYHINDSLGLEMALPQNPKILYSLVTMVENVHAFILGRVISFRCHYHTCSDDALGLALDPNEVWKGIV